MVFLRIWKGADEAQLLLLPCARAGEGALKFSFRQWFLFFIHTIFPYTCNNTHQKENPKFDFTQSPLMGKSRESPKQLFKSFYTVPKAILWKEMFICTVRNVYQVLKKCFFTANHLAEKENFVLYIRNVCHTVFLSLQRNFSLPSSPLSFRAKSLLLSLFWLQDSSAPVAQY